MRSSTVTLVYRLSYQLANLRPGWADADPGIHNCILVKTVVRQPPCEVSSPLTCIFNCSATCFTRATYNETMFHSGPLLVPNNRGMWAVPPARCSGALCPGNTITHHCSSQHLFPQGWGKLGPSPAPTRQEGTWEESLLYGLCLTRFLNLLCLCGWNAFSRHFLMMKGITFMGRPFTIIPLNSLVSS